MDRFALLLTFARKHWPRFIFIAVTGLLHVLPDVAVAHLVRGFVNDGIAHTIAEWVPVLGLIVFLFAAKGVLAFLNNRNTLTVSFDITSDVQKTLVAKVMFLDLSSFRMKEPGDLMSCIADSARRVQEILVALVRISLCEGVLVIVYVAVILSISPVIFAGLFALVVPYGLLLHIQHRMILRLARRVVEQRAGWMSKLEEIIKGMEYVKGLHAEHEEINRFNELTDRTVSMEKDVEIRKSLVAPFLELLLGIGIFLVIILAVHQLNQGYLMAGDIIAVFGLALLVIRPLNRIVVSAGTIRHEFAHLDRISELLDLASGSRRRIDENRYLVRKEGPLGIDVEEVAVTMGTDSTGLRDVSLSWNGPGLLVITGRSGSGKTTLARTIAGLVVPDRGRVRLSGRDAEGSLAAYLPQHLSLLNLGLRETIYYPDAESTDDDAGKLIERLGLNHLFEGDCSGRRAVGSGGAQVSEGEKRRLALANMLHHEYEILVLDEPLTGVHEARAGMIVELLQGVANERLLVVVSHREGILKAADRVFFLSGGTIAASGNHDDLLASDGDYKENFLVRRDEGRGGRGSA